MHTQTHAYVHAHTHKHTKHAHTYYTYMHITPTCTHSTHTHMHTHMHTHHTPHTHTHTSHYNAHGLTWSCCMCNPTMEDKTLCVQWWNAESTVTIRINCNAVDDQPIEVMSHHVLGHQFS